MKKNISKKSIFRILGVLLFVFVCGSFAQTFAQDQYIIQQAEQAVRTKIIRSKGGEVTFPAYGQTETYFISDSRTGVRGYGTWAQNYNSTPQDFSFEARVQNKNGKVDKIKYKFLSDNDGSGRVPSWAIGTFSGRNPQTGGPITLVVSNDGSVIVTFETGTTNYANISGDRLTNNGVNSRVTRITNGIRTTRLDNGEIIDYFNNSTGGGNNNTGVPSWAIGTFSGRNPQTGGPITLAVSNDGSVVVTFESGTTNYANIRGDKLTNNGVISRVTKIANGIRTTRLDNGEIIDYYKNGNTGGGNDDANVPSWAIGTFYARNPQTDGTITLTINANGNVTVDFDGSITYATVNRDRLFNNGIESKITKISNGIRTTRIDNGERIDYRRQ